VSHDALDEAVHVQPAGTVIPMEVPPPRLETLTSVAERVGVQAAPEPGPGDGGVLVVVPFPGMT
jgi:hypothetical protein